MIVSARRTAVIGLALAAAGLLFLVVGPSGPTALSHALPTQLGDAEFWRLSTEFSEPGGTFHSDNFVSNEGQFQTVIPELVARARPNGLYVGVGPEQNFTYIAAVRPAMAFIVDIRRGNLHEHLLYKALFELSADRAEFLARLFVRPKPDGLGPGSPPEAFFAALADSVPTDDLYRSHLDDVRRWLTVRHALPLDAVDLDGIDYVYRSAFFADGPDLNYRLTGQGGFGRSRGGTPTYADLMSMDDGEGRQRSYLATEENFRLVKAMHERNLIVPVVGDFGGPRALRAVGQFARDHAAVISALYASNVEQYLRADRKWEAFCANVASMPLDGASTFVRSERGGGGGRQAGGFIRFRSLLGEMQAETQGCSGRFGVQSWRP